MKFFFTLALTIMALSIANAQSPGAKESTKSIAVETAAKADVKKGNTALAMAIGAPDVSASFAGTNDLNLLLLRQGIIKA